MDAAWMSSMPPVLAASLGFLPPIVLAIVIIIVVVLIIKSLIKFAIILGIIGLAIYLLLQFGIIHF